GRDAVGRARGGADLGREVRQRREVVADERGRGGEAVPGQLHPVAGVAREADDDALLLLDFPGHLCLWSLHYTRGGQRSPGRRWRASAGWVATLGYAAPPQCVWV